MAKSIDNLVNGARQATLQITRDSFQPLEAVPLQLKKGQNVIEFVRHNSAITLPTDSRPLAVAVKDLHLMLADSAVACDILP